jgi:RNA polymerase sigma factor (TIGR02999 family)
MSDVTRILSEIERGDSHAASQLLPLVYDELRRLARQKLAQEKPGQTLQATALVHEAYLRLVGDTSDQHWDHRGHFFTAAAEAMRRNLIENARKKPRHKRGGGLVRKELDASYLAAPEVSDDVLALDEALTRLATADETAAKLVQLRYFAGMSHSAAGKISRSSSPSWSRGRVGRRSKYPLLTSSPRCRFLQSLDACRMFGRVQTLLERFKVSHPWSLKQRPPGVSRPSARGPRGME